MTTESQTRHSQSSGASAPAPPTPSFLFRGHDAPIHSLEFFASNTFLVTGDELGWICVWDIWKRRQIYKWQGHSSASVLALKAIPIRSVIQTDNSLLSTKKNKKTKEKERQDLFYIVSHGRDNEIHVWDINAILKKSLGRSSDIDNNHSSSNNHVEDLAPIFSLPVNAVNFCKMSILAIDAPNSSPSSLSSEQQQQNSKSGQGQKDSPLKASYQNLYIAVPSPLTPTLVDIYDITKPERTFASISAESSTIPPTISQDNSISSGSGDKKWGSVMALQLFQTRIRKPLDLLALGLNSDEDKTSNEDATDTTGSKESDGSLGILHMLVGYEDGTVCLFQEKAPPSSTSSLPTNQSKKPKRSMQVLWSIKCHREPVLALDISSDLQFAASCGSDNVLVKYNLFSRLQGVPEFIQESLKSNGIADIKIRDDNKIIGLAGWDGRIRIFSAKGLKPLAVLKHHREGLYCLGFAHVQDLEQNVNTQGTTAQENRKSAPIRDADIDDDSDEEGEEKDNDDGDDSSEQDSDFEYMIESRREWARSHWIAVGGKESRISLWKIY